MEIIDLIKGLFVQDGLNRLVLRFYMSLNTGNRFCTSYLFRISCENCQLYSSATQGHTTCATSFLARPATASRVLAMDARCGLSTRGHWDGPVICNEMGKGIVVQHGKCIAIIDITFFIHLYY